MRGPMAVERMEFELFGRLESHEVIVDGVCDDGLSFP